MVDKSIAQLFDLTGKVAIVTGGSMGIGQAIAFRLAEAGARIMVTARRQEAADQTVQDIIASGGIAQAICADAGSTGDAAKTVQSTLEAFGRLDILVNNAGIFPFSPALQIDEEMWDEVHNINLKGVFFCSKAAAEEMVREGHKGKIINIAAIEALHPVLIGGIGHAHYPASKGGVVSLTRSLALEWAPYDIIVNAVLPGIIMTPGAGTVVNDLLADGTISSDVLNESSNRIPLHRFGEPDDIAKTVLFLASAAADYMTGSLIVADGGYLLS